jgi:hypothetical protein
VLRFGIFACIEVGGGGRTYLFPSSFNCKALVEAMMNDWSTKSRQLEAARQIYESDAPHTPVGFGVMSCETRLSLVSQPQKKERGSTDDL